MPQAFDATNAPFDRLDHQEIEELRATLDIGYFRPGEIIIDRGQRSEDLHVIIKGSVEERDDDLVEALLGPNESFDARSLVHGAAGARFVAAEETLCYLAPKAKILDLIGRNALYA
jgi:CBS domain-containing protein